MLGRREGRMTVDNTIEFNARVLEVLRAARNVAKCPDRMYLEALKQALFALDKIGYRDD
jgi:hypothetical protein